MRNYARLINELGEDKLRKDEILAAYTSIRIGGPADLFFEAETVADLVRAVQAANKYSVPFFVLGGGTNLLVSDEGFRGLIIRNKSAAIRPSKIKGETQVAAVYLRVDSGVQVNRLVRYALEEGLAGLEYFLGQPGTVGGAIWINAHNIQAGQKYFSERIVEANLLGKNGKIRTVTVDYFQFGYDRSKIQETEEIVLDATFNLQKGNKKQLWQIGQKALTYRRTTQPLNYPSSGCSFRNISLEQARRIATPGNTTSCGYLLESVGLKGVQIGGAKFSPQHAAFIVNVGNARARDVHNLLALAKAKIKAKYGIEIREEIVLLGEFK